MNTLVKWIIISSVVVQRRSSHESMPCTGGFCTPILFEKPSLLWKRCWLPDVGLPVPQCSPEGITSKARDWGYSRGLLIQQVKTLLSAAASSWCPWAPFFPHSVTFSHCHRHEIWICVTIYFVFLEHLSVWIGFSQARSNLYNLLERYITCFCLWSMLFRFAAGCRSLLVIKWNYHGTLLLKTCIEMQSNEAKHGM